MKKRDQRPSRRQPPTEVEVEARRYHEAHGSMLDRLPDEALELAEEIADQAAFIRAGWSDDMEFMRSRGIYGVPPGQSPKKFVQCLREEAAVNGAPFSRIFGVDRERFGFSYWLHTTVHVPPERYFWDELTLEEAAYNSKRGRRAFHFALKVASPKHRETHSPDPPSAIAND
jgi:hypothetical protein